MLLRRLWLHWRVSRDPRNLYIDADGNLAERECQQAIDLDRPRLAGAVLCDDGVTRNEPLLTLTLTQEEAEALYDAVDDHDAEYGFYVGTYPWCPPEVYQAGKKKGDDLMRRIHTLAHGTPTERSCK